MSRQVSFLKYQIIWHFYVKTMLLFTLKKKVIFHQGNIFRLFCVMAYALQIDFLKKRVAFIYVQLAATILGCYHAAV